MMISPGLVLSSHSHVRTDIRLLVQVVVSYLGL